MKPNKLIETIAIMDTLERKRFRNVIKNKRKSNLLPLYELCLAQIEKKQPASPKEEVYRMLFGKEYTPADDFLLRNKYRQLTDEAEEFLRQVSIERYYPGVADAARLRAIIDSGNTELFRKEFDVLSRKYGNDLLFWQTIDPVYLLYFMTSLPMSTPHIARIKSLIEACRERLDLLYGRTMADYEVKQAYAEKVHSILADTVPQPCPSRIPESSAADPLVRYRQLKAASYYVSGQEKIKLLLAAEEILSDHNMPGLGADEIWWLRASTGLEYYLQHDYNNAILYYDALFASPQIEKFARLPEAVLNYLSALMSVGDYEKALNAPVIFEEKIQVFGAIFYKYICLKALCFLFLDVPGPQQARKELNRMKEHTSELDFVYWKVILLLSFATENRWDEAENELKNLLKTRTIKQNERPDLRNLTAVLGQLLRFGLARESGREMPAATLNRYQKKIEELIRDPGAFVHPPRLIARIFREMRK
ncbi:MAG: hypothetical protein IBJ09_15390 [Bacteroidia bacterium]|nr:hypothetical protein [Bacteroidia bacterium]